MASYNIVAKINQIVTKEVRLVVDARSSEEAEEKTRRALGDYPKAIEEPGIRLIVAEKSHYWVPRDIEIIHSNEEGKKVA